MNITEIAFTVLPVTDIARARAFYEEVLCLKPTSVFQKEGMAFIEYDIAAGTLALGCGHPLLQPSAHGGAIALEVGDFSEVISHLKERNCRMVMDAAETPVCHMAIIADPDGNFIIIHKRKAPMPSAAQA